MSSPKYRWWDHARKCVRDYPKLYREWEELKTVPVTPNYSTVGHGTGISNPTEQVALRVLPMGDQEDFDAVRQAIAETRRRPDGANRVKMISLYYGWRRQRYNLIGAGNEVGLEESAAYNWHVDFIRLVAVYHGWLSREDYKKMKKRKKKKKE